MKKVLSMIALLALSSCASYNPIPANYGGPIALISDSGRLESSTTAEIFALIEVDGHAIENSFQTSRKASKNQGFTPRLSLTERHVPAIPLKLKIRGSHMSAAPIHELASRAMGTFLELEGTVEFKPEPNRYYTVVGKLAKGERSVWIEDAQTHQPITEKIVEKQ